MVTVHIFCPIFHNLGAKFSGIWILCGRVVRVTNSYAVSLFSSVISIFCFLTLLCRFLKLPSCRPSVVCENCLYSQEKDRRARAFHIIDPKGILEMLLVFLEDRTDGELLPPSLDICMVNY